MEMPLCQGRDERLAHILRKPSWGCRGFSWGCRGDVVGMSASETHQGGGAEGAAPLVLPKTPDIPTTSPPHPHDIPTKSHQKSPTEPKMAR